MAFLLQQRALSGSLLSTIRQSSFLKQNVTSAIHKHSNINSSRVTSLRFMGGGAEPPEPQSMKAEFCGTDLEKHDTAWKPITQFTYAASLVILGLIAFAPDTSIQTWASQEARARLKLRDEGVKLEFGSHYDTEENYDFEMKSPIDDPFQQEEDEDDDEDEGEEEEEEDDDDDDDDE